MTRSGFSLGSIFVVTREVLGRAQELFDAFLALSQSFPRHTGFQLNHAYPQGLAARSRNLVPSPEEWSCFMVQIFDIWNRAGRPFILSPFDEMIAWFRGDEERLPYQCASSGRCSDHHLGIDWELNVAGCGRRLDSRSIWGSLHNASLLSIVDGCPEIRTLRARSFRLEGGSCAGCEYFPLCRGGCPDDASVWGVAITERTPMCAGLKEVFVCVRAAAGRCGVKEAAIPVSPDSHQEERVIEISSNLEWSEEAAERWIVVPGDGRLLRFDSDLAHALEARPLGLRIWVPNKHARSLAMWRDLVRDSQAMITLFEVNPEFEGACQTLNDLRLDFALDVWMLTLCGGAESLHAMCRRFLYSPEWAVQIQPFSAMLSRAIGLIPPHRDQVDPWGLPRSRPKIKVRDLTADVDGRLIALFVAAEHEPGCREIPTAPEACSNCACWGMCGGQLAVSPGDDRRCLRWIAEEIAVAGQQIAASS